MVDPILMVDSIPKVDPIPMVDPLPMVDPISMVDPIPMVNLRSVEDFIPRQTPYPTHCNCSIQMLHR